MPGSGKRAYGGVRVVVNTTDAVKRRLEELAERRGWSLAKAAGVVIGYGLEVWLGMERACRNGMEVDRGDW